MLKSENELLRPLSDLVKELEQKHGAGVLLEMIPKDLRDKFDRQRVKLDMAVKSKDITAIQKHAEAMIRAWHKVEEVAVEQDASIWRVRHSSGATVAIVQGAKRQVPGCVVLTVEELVKFVPAKVLEVKDLFAGAEVKNVVDKKKNHAEPPWDDEIPF